MVKISIIIPVFNAEETLVRCVESLKPDTLEDGEILLVEDGSRDRSLELCNALAKQYANVRVLENGENRGVSHARNRGLDAAAGDWILFVDSDDAVAEGFAPELISLAEAHPGDLALCGYRGDRVMGLTAPEETVTVERKDLFSLLEAELLHYVWNKAFDRRIIQAAELRFDEALSMGEDLQFALDYLEALPEGRCVVRNRPLYEYRQNPSNAWAAPEHFEPGLARIRQLEEITGDSSGARKAEEKQKRDFIYHIARNRSLAHGSRIREIGKISGNGLLGYLGQGWLTVKENPALCRAALILAVLTLQWLQLEYSPIIRKTWEFAQSEMLILMNWGLVAFVNLLLALAAGKWERSLTVTTALCGLWSVAGYYVTAYHGSPLCFTLLRSAGTAMNVAGSYDFTPDGHVAALLGMSLLQGILLFLLRKRPTASKRGWLTRLGLTGLTGVFLYATLWGPAPIKPHKTIGWSWAEAMNTYGYVCCLAEDLGNLLNPYTAPAGYDSGAILWEEPENDTPEQYPDVILILNETFYDLSVYTELETDKDIFSGFYGLDNAVTGLAVTPVVGGGTNNAEYELLTSNSMYLLNADAPFHYADLGSGGNAVRYFNGLGYSTLAMHCADGANYARDRAYPRMGFSRALLGKENFQYLSCYGNRPWLDSDNYRDLAAQYEAAGDGPRFLYLLTYQNHGGWEQNDGALDTVHAVNIPSELEDRVNEYLTGVDQSVRAFLELVEYFSGVDRPVIVCMVGDHGPSFLEELTPKEGLSQAEAEILARSTPYVIWANFPLTGEDGDASLADLVPMVLEQAGLPMTPYYETILALREAFPVRTADGVTVDRAGNIRAYDPGTPEFSLLTQYYYMEYNGLAGGAGYIPALFSAEGRWEP